MDVIAGELQDRDYGIVVLTQENMRSPWVNFEAGALGKTLGAAKVAPLLLDLTRADVIGPIAQFQSTLLTDRDDVRQFIRDIATLSPEIPEASIDALFDAKWPELDAVVGRAVGMDSPKTTRTPESMLEEVLESVRRIERERIVFGTPSSRSDDDLSKAVMRGLKRQKGVGYSINTVQELTKQGREVRVDTQSTSVGIDEDLMQRIADNWDVRISVSPHGVVFTPRGRLQDPDLLAMDGPNYTTHE